MTLVDFGGFFFFVFHHENNAMMSIKSTIYKHIEIIEVPGRMGGSFEQQLRRKVEAEPSLPTYADVSEDLSGDIFGGASAIMSPPISPELLWPRYFASHDVQFVHDSATQTYTVKVKDARVASRISSALALVSASRLQDRDESCFIASQDSSSLLLHSGVTLVGLGGYLLMRRDGKLHMLLPGDAESTGKSSWRAHFDHVVGNTTAPPFVGANKAITITANMDTRSYVETLYGVSVVPSQDPQDPQDSQASQDSTPDIPPPPVMGPSQRQPRRAAAAADDPNAADSEGYYTVVAVKYVGPRFRIVRQYDCGSVEIPEAATPVAF